MDIENIFETVRILIASGINIQNTNKIKMNIMFAIWFKP